MSLPQPAQVAGSTEAHRLQPGRLLRTLADDTFTDGDSLWPGQVPVVAALAARSTQPVGKAWPTQAQSCSSESATPMHCELCLQCAQTWLWLEPSPQTLLVGGLHKSLGQPAYGIK